MYNNSPYTLAVRTRKPWISPCVVRGIRAVCRVTRGPRPAADPGGWRGDGEECNRIIGDNRNLPRWRNHFFLCNYLGMCAQKIIRDAEKHRLAKFATVYNILAIVQKFFRLWKNYHYPRSRHLGNSREGVQSPRRDFILVQAFRHLGFGISDVFSASRRISVVTR